MSADIERPPTALAPAAARRRPSSVVLIGALIGLTWSAALRGWMAQLAGKESSVTWLTLVFLLFPGALVGALLGHAADAQARGRTPRRILVWAPLLLAAVLLDPTMLLLLLRQGYGGGSLMVVATALSAGYAFTHRRLSMPTVLCGLLAMSGLAAIAFMATLAAPLATPRGVWVGVFGLSLMLVLCLASALPHRHLPPLGSWAYVGIGGLCGLAWASGLRSFMAAVVGPASQVTWVNTVVWILLVGAIVGALLGYAARLRSTGLPRPALTAAPLLFAAVLLPGLLHPTSMFVGGIGGGAVGVPLLGMAGAYGLAGRSVWARVACGALFLAGVTLWVVVADDVGGPGFALDTARGLWASLLYLCLLATLALAAAIPLRASDEPRESNALSGEVRSHQG